MLFRRNKVMQLTASEAMADILTFTFLFFHHIGFCESLVLESPSNRIALLDTNVTFDCLTNTTSAIRWDKLNTNTYKWDSVWNGFDLLNPDERSSYHVTLEKSTVTQRSRLVISSVRLSDSGVFACREAGQTTKFAAQLVVTSLKSFRFEDRQSSVVTSEDLAFTARHNCSLYDLSSDGSIKRCRLDSLLYNVSTNFVNNKTISDGTTSPVAPVRTTSTLMCTVVINPSGTCKRSRPCDISQCPSRQSDSGGEVRCATNVPEYSDTCFVTLPLSTGDLSVSISSQTTTNVNGSPNTEGSSSSAPTLSTGLIIAIVLSAVAVNVIVMVAMAAAIISYMRKSREDSTRLFEAATPSTLLPMSSPSAAVFGGARTNEIYEEVQTEHYEEIQPHPVYFPLKPDVRPRLPLTFDAITAAGTPVGIADVPYVNIPVDSSMASTTTMTASDAMRMTSSNL